MDLYEAIRSRRSVRAFRADPVEDDKLERILEATRLAPSACNFQPWRFYVVRDATARDRLGESYGAPWFAAAPVIIVACGRPDEAWSRGDGKSYLDVDVAIAFEHLVLAAEAEGLGTCWIGAFDPRVARTALGIPDELEPIAMTPLGYPAETPEARGRRALGDIVTFVD